MTGTYLFPFDLAEAQADLVQKAQARVIRKARATEAERIAVVKAVLDRAGR